jgi:F-type H+-transporting ATPase subunit a
MISNLILAIPPISVKSEVLFNFMGVDITNAMFGMLAVDILLILFAIAVNRKASIIPSKLQVVFELPFVWLKENIMSAFGSKKDAEKLTPIFLSLFLVFLFANQLSIIPLIMDITANFDGTTASLFKVPTSDFNLPIAMALIVVVLVNMIALVTSPLKHIGSFIKIMPILKSRSIGEFANSLLEFFLGLLDIITEVAKVISLSARLFGNVFAGELMIVIITYIASFTNFIVPIPFIVLSVFSGLVQAMVFPLLSIQYMAGTLSNVEE